MSKQAFDDLDLNEIDRYALDEEAINTDKARRYAASKMAEAIKKRDYAKINLKVKQAEIGDRARRQPESFGLDKVTDKAIEHLVLKKTENKQKKLADYESNVVFLQETVNRLWARKDTVGDLIWLHSMGYMERKKPKGMKKSEMDNYKHSAMNRRLNKKGK